MGTIAIVLLAIIALAVIGKAGRGAVLALFVLGLVGGGYALIAALFGGLLLASAG